MEKKTKHTHHYASWSSYFWMVVGCAAQWILFIGEPDGIDAIKHILFEKAGYEYQLPD